LIFFVNSFVWKGNVDDPAPFWCDLSTAILAVVAHGITSATICINRQLYRLSKAQAVLISKSQKRKELCIDLLIGLGFPLLGVGGHAIVQGHRYDIYEDVGCTPTTYNVTLAYPLYFIWPLVLAIISAVYGCELKPFFYFPLGLYTHFFTVLALRQFLKRRKSFESLLSSTNSGMPKNRYIRLMWLCSLDLLLSIPYYTYNLIDNLVNRKVYPWVSWSETQADWYRVDRFRRIIIDMVPEIRIALYTLTFGVVFMSFVFFLVFGFTRETIKSYKNAYYWCMRPFGIKKPARVIGGLPQGYGGPPKRSWLDKLLRRDPVPFNSVTNTTGSIPTFNGGQQSSGQGKSIPSARPKAATHSATDTLNFDDFDEEEYIQTRSMSTTNNKGGYKQSRPRSNNSEKSPFSSGTDVVPNTPLSGGSSVIVIDGRRLTIPGLNAMASFDSSELEEKEGQYSPTMSTASTAIHEEEKKANPKYKGPSRI
ncbi:a-factor receptor, partial [Serendipita sp. 396]